MDREIPFSGGGNATYLIQRGGKKIKKNFFWSFGAKAFRKKNRIGSGARQNKKKKKRNQKKKKKKKGGGGGGGTKTAVGLAKEAGGHGRRRR